MQFWLVTMLRICPLVLVLPLFLCEQYWPECGGTLPHFAHLRPLSVSHTQHTNDFALYTEAIKFFNHPESMVRIAVRTITLNVYKGE